MNMFSTELVWFVLRGLTVLLALATLAWAMSRWRRDHTRDSQRVFEQLDLVRAELLELQEKMQNAQVSRPSTPSVSAPSAPKAAVKRMADLPQAPPAPRIPREVAPQRTETRVPKGLTNAVPRGYEVAARLARTGASVEELMKTCALSRHEAELLVRLNAGMRNVQAPQANAAGAVRSDAGKRGVTPHANVNQLQQIGRSGGAQAVASRTPTAPARPTSKISLVG